MVEPGDNICSLKAKGLISRISKKFQQILGGKKKSKVEVGAGGEWANDITRQFQEGEAYNC